MGDGRDGHRPSVRTLVCLSVLGLLVLTAGTAIAHHGSVSFEDDTPDPDNRGVKSTYVLEFTEDGNWQQGSVEEVRLFFGDEADLSHVDESSVSFDWYLYDFTGGSWHEQNVVDVTHGSPTAAEQDETDTEWEQVLRIRIDQNIGLINPQDFRVTIDDIGNPTSTGTHELVLNTYFQDEIVTNRDGPDESHDENEITAFTISDSEATTVEVDGQPGTTAAGEPIAGPPTVSVTDAAGDPVYGVDVTATVVDGSVDGGTETVPTDWVGTATFDDLSIEAPGEYELEFSIDDADSDVADGDSARTDRFTVEPGPADSVIADAHPTATQTAGEPIDGEPSAVVTDSFGNPVSAVSVSVEAVVADGSVEAGTTTVDTDANGTATFDDLTIEHADEGYRLEFSIDGGDGNVDASASDRTDAFTVEPADAASVSVETQPGSTQVAGEIVDDEPSALVTDPFGNPIADVAVSVASDGDGALASGTTTRDTDATGTATFDDLVFEFAADEYRLEFTIDGDDGGVASDDSALSDVFAVEPADPIEFDLSPTTATATASDEFGDGDELAYTVVVRDEFENPVPGVEFEFTDTGTAIAVDGDRTLETDGDGTATVRLQSTVAQANVTITATPTSGTEPTLTAVGTVEPAPPDLLEVSNEVETAGDSGQIALTLEDEFGNRLADERVDVVDDDGLSGLETPIETNESGEATASFREETAGEYDVAFEAGDADAAATVQVEAADPVGLAIVGQPTTTAAGEAIEDDTGKEIAVEIRDSFGNRVGGETTEVTLSPSANDVDLVGDASVTTVGGVATFSGLNIETAGTYVLEAEAEGLAGDATSPFTVEAAATESVVVTADPDGTQTAGEVISDDPTVRATDAFGNPVAGVAVSVEAIDGAGGLSGGETTVETIDGVATFDDLRITVADDAYRLEFSVDGDHGNVAADGVVRTTPFDVEPADTNSVTVVTEPDGTQTAGEALTDSPTVLASDRFGNPIANRSVTATVNASTFANGTTQVTARTGSDGRATFEGLTLEASGTYVLLFAADAGDLATTEPFTVAPAATETVLLEPAVERSVVSGETLEFDATAVDEYANVVEDDETAFDWTNATANGTFDETDLGTFDVTAAFDGVSNATTVTVLKPANYTVSITGTNAPVRSGRTLTVDATIENVGEVSGVTQVELIEGANATVDDRKISLAAGTHENVTLGWVPTSTDVGSTNLTVRTATHSTTTDVEVESRPRSSSGGGGGMPMGSRDSPEDGETETAVTVDVEGAKSGDEIRADTSDLETDVPFDGLTLELATDRDVRITLTGDNSEEKVPRTVDAFETQTGTVSAGHLDVEHDLTPEDVSTATVEFAVPLSVLAELDVDPADVELHRQTGETGNWQSVPTTHVGSDGTDARFEASSPAVSSFVVGTGAPIVEVTDATLEHSRIDVGESTTVSATVENRGRSGGDRTLTLTADSEEVATQTIDVGEGASETVTFTFEPASAGEYDLAIESSDVGTLVAESPNADENGAEPDSDADSVPAPWATLVALGIVVLFVAGLGLRLGARELD
ncbi:Ig-like domain-containing protein [Natrarchaeobius sp. A-rgal3]|uniref:PGF-pre-PGF domain-containing protein n=1 Tax=Natrarchaeobius versutus TaxID=1679078 RepID=UPI00350EF72E